MGKMNNAVLNYLSDKRRFADLINAELYGGRQVVKKEGLTEISAATFEELGKSAEGGVPKRRERRGDLAMRYTDGAVYRIFLTEAQNKVLYVLPVKNLEYITANYKKQINTLRREHERKKDYKSVDESFSGLRKEDRLKPVYLLWLYHGERKWDGARSLKELMDFGDDHDAFGEMFQDFRPQLLCVNEMPDTGKYRTELRELMDLLRCRSDKAALQEMTERDARFEGLDEETYETASVLLNAPSIWRKRKRYMVKGGNYNMCKAMRDWAEEIREEQGKIIKFKDEQLKRKEAQLEQKDAELEQKDAELEQKDTELEQKDAELKQKDEEIRLLKKELQKLKR